ncbi:hypothetical protein DPM19_22300 [Actinomadura craniellae]|uniref:Uncharacterized protein n=1 Tax=Actinomadura craniellae TaxID=2231787 RepID=A0A365H290_9ACTN|nr:hypothetical protein [Actinomadura craniellae]RAY13217.1 hypothetical protein DPM19_22300 [Actinomadura craniellae]
MEMNEILLRHWEDQRAKARHSEDQRSSLTNMILVISSVGLGFVAQRGLQNSMLAVTLPLIVIGLYGAIGTAKLAERASYHNAHARALSRRLDGLVPDLRLRETYSDARSRHSARHGLVEKVRLRYVWVTLHLGIALTGLFLSLAILLG